jgi:6-phosphogluconate dehydrogenase
MIEQEADPKAVLAAVTEGHDLFVQTLSNGFGILAGRERERADAAKAQSDSIRAAVVLKDKYAAALELYNQGVTALDEARNEDAWRLFEQDASDFANVYQEALIRRNAAQAAMDAAARKVQDVNNLADEADIIAPLPEEVEAAEEAPLPEGGQE